MLYLYPCYFIVVIIWNQVDAKVKKKTERKITCDLVVYNSKRKERKIKEIPKMEKIEFSHKK